LINFEIIYYDESNIFWQIETKKAKAIINRFLIREKDCDSFEIITLETRQLVNVAELSFNIFLDRIYQNKNGNLIIFNYKTSEKVNLGSIALDKIINQVQLPIHALNNNTDAISYIQIGSQEIAYIDYKKNRCLRRLTR
jgi:hypothetical protein